MYPEVHNYLGRELTKRIMQAQIKGERPEYKKRQAMSLFLGTNLDSTFTPQAIQTIQGVYAIGKAKKQQEMPKQDKKNLTKMDDHYLTGSQARIGRQQNQKV